MTFKDNLKKIITLTTVAMILMTAFALLNFSLLKSARRRVQYVDGVMIHMLQARHAEKDFLMRGDSLQTAVVDSAMSLAQVQLGELDQRGTRHLGDSLAQSLQHYVEHFRRVADLRTTRGLNHDKGLQGDMRKKIHTVEEELKAVGGAAEIAVCMLTLRRYEKDFLMRGDQKSVTNFNKGVETFQAIVAGSRLDAGLKERIQLSVDDYSKAFNSIVALDLEVVAAQVELQDAVDHVEPMAGRLSAAIVHAVEVQSSLLLVVFLLVATGGVIAVTRSVNRIATGISTPVTELTDVMGHLAEGNYSLEVPCQDRTDELGRMALAVDVFKRNGLEMRRLEGEHRNREAQEHGRRARLQLADAFEASVGRIVTAVHASSEDLQATAQTMNALSPRRPAARLTAWPPPPRKAVSIWVPSPPPARS
jgi:methyl-accepting chemotaxis protein